MSITADKWTREATRQLVDLYREEPCLWNVKSTDYRNRNKKATAIQKITENMSTTDLSLSTKELRKKIDTLSVHEHTPIYIYIYIYTQYILKKAEIVHI